MSARTRAAPAGGPPAVRGAPGPCALAEPATGEPISARSRWWGQALVVAAAALSVATRVQAQSLEVRYHTYATGASVGQLRPLVNLVNTGTSPVPLSAITIRYWFTRDGAPSLGYRCDRTPRGCASVTARFSAAPVTATADTYLQLGFTAGAGTLAAGQATGDIQGRVTRSDGLAFQQTNDWSFDATKTASARWDRITVYVNGAQVWGIEPVAAPGPGAPPATADVTLTIDAGAGQRPISPYVYGYNAARLADAPPGTTYLRSGGNRWTTYNWTNNYSNAGSDWGPYSNDTYLGTPGQGPGAPMAAAIDDARAHGVAALVTIPIQGWVSQARSGNVPLGDPVASWFVPNLPAKGSPFTLTPGPTSATVYQDELASFVANRWGAGATPHLALDNEPDLWGYVDASGAGQGTHPEVQRTQLSEAAFLQESIASATAIKAAVPGALVYGPVSYGWNGFVSFQNAPDAAGATIDASFLDFYLAGMSSASTARRLLDVLDVHWYSEAQSTGCASSADAGVRVTATSNTDCVVAARVQAPRSLYDPTYVESSWITQWTTAGSALGQAIQLVPRLQAKIAAKFPGTRLALTEYNHGGEDHVSGAVAEADTLGILGREGVYAASFWSLNSAHDWAFAAWRAYRNYDGAGHDFGDTSVSARTSDLAHVSVYASVDAARPGRVVLVIVHRPTLGSGGTLDLRSRTVQVSWASAQPLGTARAWQLASGASPVWRAVNAPAPAGNALTLTLPALSVTTLELTP